MPLFTNDVKSVPQLPPGLLIVPDGVTEPTMVAVLVEKGWVMNLDGCLESNRFALSGGAGGFEEIDARANIRSKLHLLLKTNQT